MQRRPRASGAILDARVLRSIVPVAVVMTVATLVVYATSDAATRNTMAFTTFVLLQLANVLAVRGADTGVFGRHLFTNRWVWSAIALVVAIQVAVVHTPIGQSLFDTVSLAPAQWLVATALALLPVLVTELRTRLRR